MDLLEGDILLIENNKERRNQINSVLRNMTYRVDAATGGFHAFSLLEERQFKIVIVGSSMDDMSALEIMGLIRHRHTCSDLPVVYRPKKLPKDMIEDLKGLELNGVVVGDNFADLMIYIQRYAPLER